MQTVASVAQALISMREIRFFTGCLLKLHEIVEISYWWANETSVSKTIQQTGHSCRTIVDCYNYHRDVCTQWFLDHPVQVGVGKVVEIDKSKFGRKNTTVEDTD